jgi:hypothetical protein
VTVSACALWSVSAGTVACSVKTSSMPRHYWACPTAAVLSARLNLAETGSTNPIVEIWVRQDGPALWPRGHVHGPSSPRDGPSSAELRNPLAHSMMATRHEYVARQTHHHVPRLIMAPSLLLDPPSLSLPALLHSLLLHSTDATVFLSVCICTCVCIVDFVICDWKKKLITRLS